MNEALTLRIKELYEEYYERPYKVFDIFKDYYGEDRVDIQGIPSLESLSKSTLHTRILELLSFKNLKTLLSTHSLDPEFSHNRLEDCPEPIISSIIPYLNSLGPLPNIKILVHFPEVRITNENDKYVDIKDLYACVAISYDGTINGTFTLNRAHYYTSHFNSDYMHSHVAGIHKDNLAIFREPCTGSGPINDTISSLSLDFDEDIWRLFCLELDKYVRVESLTGVPYRKLERISKGRKEKARNEFIYTPTLTLTLPENLKTIVKDFIRYFIQTNTLVYNYKQEFSIGMSFADYIITISNSFIGWYNNNYNNKVYNVDFNTLLQSRVLRKRILDNNIFYTIVDASLNFRAYINTPLFTFKGNQITLQIEDDPDSSPENFVIILNESIALWILTKILNIINYECGKLEDSEINERVKYF